MSKIQFDKLGKKGGKATLEKYGRSHYSKIAKKMWRKKRKLQKAA